MNFIESIKERAKKNKKTIVLPESMDRRVLEAACKARDEEIADIIILGNLEEISKNNSDLIFDNIRFINPNTSEDTENLINQLVEIRKNKGYRYLIEADGSINEENISFCRKAGADLIVSGRFIFDGKIEEQLWRLRMAGEAK